MFEGGTSRKGCAPFFGFKSDSNRKAPHLLPCNCDKSHGENLARFRLWSGMFFVHCLANAVGHFAKR